jgi:hypothetical protein
MLNGLVGHLVPYIIVVGMLAKFSQHPEFKKKLLDTEDKLIIEHSSNDNYWADGGDGLGKNMLGVLLMQVREILLRISNNPDLILPPWIAFPITDSRDLFWRMGLGENYLFKWYKFIDNYGLEKYRTNFPAPVGWEDSYEDN